MHSLFTSMPLQHQLQAVVVLAAHLKQRPLSSEPTLALADSKMLLRQPTAGQLTPWPLQAKLVTASAKAGNCCSTACIAASCMRPRIELSACHRKWLSCCHLGLPLADGTSWIMQKMTSEWCSGLLN